MISIALDVWRISTGKNMLHPPFFSEYLILEKITRSIGSLFGNKMSSPFFVTVSIFDLGRGTGDVFVERIK